jgi:hypothetical protein
MASHHRGRGVGGLQAAQALKSAPVEVTLIDRRNYHLFQPLLYQVATGSLSPGQIAAPLRSVLSRQKNTRVLLGEVVDFYPLAKCVRLADGASFEYDSLIVAAGAQSSYYGHDAWREWAPSLKSVEEATNIPHKILYAFEVAEPASSSGGRHGRSCEQPLSGRARIADGQGELHGDARPDVRGGPQPPPVRLDDRTADREAHAHACGLGRIKRLEEPRQTLRVQADAGVLDGDEHVAGFMGLGLDP